jgi:hypothetical protein
MSFFATMLVLVLMTSVVICWLTISRVVAYNKKFHLPENKKTKLFKVLTKEHFVFFYVASLVAHIIISIWFLATL